MKDFLIEMFGMNRDANLKMTGAIKKLPEQDECIKHLSHLANCQYKWLDRINIFPDESQLDWWDPVYTLDELPDRFEESSNQWIDYLSGMNDDEIAHFLLTVG